MDEINEETVISRYLCPNLCQCLKFEGRECEVCGEKLEFIGMFNEKDLDAYLAKKQLEKFYVKTT